MSSPRRIVVTLFVLPGLCIAGCGQQPPSGTGEVSMAQPEPVVAEVSPSSPESPVARGASEQSTQPVTSSTTTRKEADIELRNRLSEETSPYLLQHEKNPVAWFAWGPEAFEAARTLDRPIFLSVGYSTCYWCHVMERESFENEQTAAIMNELFVCIKVDREERPDVDDIYMAAVQLANQGRGGWPMSVFLEPQTLRPFLGGTYYPAEQFRSILGQVSGFWNTRRPDVLKQSAALANAVEQQVTARAEARSLGPRDVERAISQVLTTYDREDGGFVGAAQRAPKFPTPPTLDFLIGAGWEMEPIRRALTHTLDRMAIGGMYDQVGGGFHRYSTDSQWLVPHFEKMLYDNGQLVSTYAEAFRRTDDPFYAEIMRETLDYTLREMTSPQGAFYSAQDAEVNHREGQNYLWLEAELRQTLTEAGLQDDVALAIEAYGFGQGTNFQDPHHPEDGPRNVIHLVERPDVLAVRLSMDGKELNRSLVRINEALLAARDQRDQPLTDDKVLAGWNGLMIGAMADGARALSEPVYRRAAERAADFVLGQMRADDGGLLRSSRGSRARIDAFAEDYALLTRGLIALYRANRETRYRDAAVELTAEARRRFWDESAGGYFDTLADQADLFVRTKSTYDGAVPCANSVMANNLMDLHELTGEDRYLDDAQATLEGLSGVLKDRPASAVLSMLALDRMLKEHPQRITGEEKAPTGSRAKLSEPVEFSTSTRTVRITPGEPARFEVTVQVAPGYHVNSSQPGIDYLIPLKISLTGADGIDLYVDYPDGERYDGPEGVMYVHHGTVTVPVRLEAAGKPSGRPRLMITYQVCTDKMCLAPDTKRLPIGIIVR